MSRSLLSLFLASAAIYLPSAHAQTNNQSSAERFAKPDEALVTLENTFWKRIPIPVPDGIILETSGILPLPGKRLLVTTRRGEMWWIDGAFDENPNPKFTLFASGLHEPLGIIAAPKGGYYVAQREELTRVVDTDNDGRADVFETVCKIPPRVGTERQSANHAQRRVRCADTIARALARLDGRDYSGRTIDSDRCRSPLSRRGRALVQR
jgi:hypothetical protein